MNSRERVAYALNHKQPDKVPISLGGHICDSFTKYAKDNYERYLGFEASPHIVTNKPMGSVATPEKILEIYNTDFRTVRMKAAEKDSTVILEDGSYIDEFGCLWKPCEYYYDIVKRPLSGVIDKSDIIRSKWPDPYDPGRIRGLKQEAQYLRENTGYSIVADFACAGPFEASLFIRGWDDFLCDLYTDPKLAEALMDKITEIDMQFWDAFLSEVGEYVDVICFGDDLAMQDRPIISVEIYDKLIKKYHKKLYSYVKTKTRAKVFQHCCGSVYVLLPGLIEAGVEILNPIQTSAKNMEPWRLKKEYGSELVFWGGLDVQNILPFGMPEEIDAEIKKLMEILGKGGGYIFAPAHNIQPLVPAKNIEAMFEASLKYRNYK